VAILGGKVMRSCTVKMSLIDPIAAERVFWAENGGWKGVCESLSIWVRDVISRNPKSHGDRLENLRPLPFSRTQKSSSKNGFRTWLTSPAFDGESRFCGARTSWKRGFSGRRRRKDGPGPELKRIRLDLRHFSSTKHLNTAFPVGQICSLLAETSGATADDPLNLHRIQRWHSACSL
jgi:hypothetical protein